jgi:UPF0755 protein
MKRLLAVIFILLGLAIVTVAGVSYWISSAINTPKEHTHGSDHIKIEKGSTPRQIVDQLADAEIIKSPTATMLYLRTIGDGSKLQAGEYQFASPITTLQVLKQLEKGQDQTIKLTIPEGFTRFDIAKRIAEWSVRRPDAASAVTQDYEEKRVVALMDDTTLIRDIAPEAKNLEGYMYPTTYVLSKASTPESVIKMMVEQFRKFWKPEWTQQAKSIGRTPHEIVTIASLIETETGVESERPVVAGIINNRLSKGIPLGIDQTNVYIAKMLGKWDGTINKSDLEVDSPYNTRIKTGIPPGPISSVTESSIRAALNPTPSDYLYYVRNVDLNDGSHWFYASAAEFEKGKVKYQQWLEQQRAEKRQNEANSNQ